MVSADTVPFASVEKLLVWQQPQSPLQVGQPGQYASGHAIGAAAAAKTAALCVVKNLRPAAWNAGICTPF